jgi:hypothetical protein
VRSTLRFDASQCLVGRQFEFADLRIRQASDAIAETRFRDGPHLKGQSHRGLRRTILGSFDNGRPRESRPVEVRGQRNDKNGLEHAGQGFALPDYDGTAAGLLARTVRAEIGPPDLAPFNRRSSRSSAPAQSPRPCSASCSSSAAPLLDKRSRSHRLGSGRRTTTMPTRSPGRSVSLRTGRRTPFSNSASMISMHPRIAQAEQDTPPERLGQGTL